MRKFLLLVVLFLVPPVLMAQGTVKVTSAYGPAEWKSVSGAAFRPVNASTTLLSVGDQVRTGAEASVTLELPDGSYMVVSENSTLAIRQFWGSDLRNLVDLLVGKVRFFIQRIGGKPNPYRVNTPTALIAVRGTTFEVIVDDAPFTEVRCFEGRVAVEAVGLPDREVILDEGRKTLVRPGEYPLPPVRIEDQIARSKVIRVVRKNAKDAEPVAVGAPSLDSVLRDNDRRQKGLDRFEIPRTRDVNNPTPEIRRGKPSLRYPENQ